MEGGAWNDAKPAGRTHAHTGVERCHLSISGSCLAGLLLLTKCDVARQPDLARNQCHNKEQKGGMRMSLFGSTKRNCAGRTGGAVLKLYFSTSNQKPVCRQLSENRYFEISSAAKTGQWLRLRGKEVFDTDRQTKKGCFGGYAHAQQFV